MSDKKYHFLVAGKIAFLKGETEVQTADMNTTLVSDSGNVTVADIGRAQMQLQMRLFKVLGGPVSVLDVMLYSVNPLGLMTEEEYNNKPTGTVAIAPAPAQDV